MWKSQRQDHILLILVIGRATDKQFKAGYNKHQQHTYLTLHSSRNHKFKKSLLTWFTNVEEETACLKTKSVRTMTQRLQRMQSTLTSVESNAQRLWRTYLYKDAFPKLLLSPNLNDYSGFLLDSKNMCLNFMDVNGKQLYMTCKDFNKKGLHYKVDTLWRNVLRLNENVRPESIIQATINQ